MIKNKIYNKNGDNTKLINYINDKERDPKKIEQLRENKNTLSKCYCTINIQRTCRNCKNHLKDNCNNIRKYLKEMELKMKRIK